MPPVLAENSLLNTHPEWVCTVNEGAYLNPAIPEAADYVVQGVAELVQNYAVDGIHFDDYFYPTTDPSIDAAQFAASGEADLTAWRRTNVTRLVKASHDAVKAPTRPCGSGSVPRQPGQRPERAVHRSLRLADGLRCGCCCGLPLPPDLLGLWLYSLLRQHPLCL